MLGGFSWGQFFWCWLALSLSCWLVVVLVYYRRECVAFLRKDRVGSALRAGGARPALDVGLVGRDGSGAVVDALVAEELEPLMGRPSLPEGMSVLGAGSLAFSAGGPKDSRYDQVGLVADVLEELKGIFATLEREAGDKMMFFRLVSELGQRYGRIGGHPNIGAINAFVSGHAPFHLSSEELEGMWP